LNETELKFLMSMRCWVFPFCQHVPSSERCYRIKASGLGCDRCRFKIENEDKSKKLHGLYEKLMNEKEKRHYLFLKSKRWKSQIRPWILQHDNYVCAICRKPIGSKAHVHHILDFSADDDLTPRNLVALCDICHSKLHPVFPFGMWRLGWPDLEKVRVELESFYGEVRKASRDQSKRFNAPLEHIMMHICLICPLLNQCDIGKNAHAAIMSDMKQWHLWSLSHNKHRISELREGMNYVTVEGKIAGMDAPKEVETRYGRSILVITVLGDDSGEIQLNLFGQQADGVECGDFIRVEKGYIAEYEGRLNLNVPKGVGKIIVNPRLTIPFTQRKK
jgi:hypothetical protein